MPNMKESVDLRVSLPRGIHRRFRVIAAERGVTAAELIEFCKEKKGKYKAPKSITFVKELPVTAVGKVLRRKVREKYWKGEQRKVS